MMPVYQSLPSISMILVGDWHGLIVARQSDDEDSMVIRSATLIDQRDADKYLAVNCWIIGVWCPCERDDPG